MGKNGKLGRPARFAPANKAKSSNKTAVRREESPPASNGSTIPKELQQKCLNIFREALWTGPEDIAALQEVKGHLYNRDFATAFGSDHYLRAYALRWSAARALGYLQVFEDLEDAILDLAEYSSKSSKLSVLALGGGAGAELVALAGWLSQKLDREGTESNELQSIHIDLVDIASWDSVAQALHSSSTSPPALSQYASAAAKEANKALVPVDRFDMRSGQADILDWNEAIVNAKAGGANIVTLMFTLNELYSASVPKTQRLLSLLTAAMRPGALLLVVDSPGSYSTVMLGGAEKKYPMQWLLDHTLLGKVGTDFEKHDWEKIVSDDSKWFRLPEGLAYPVELENMRHQIHLYKRKQNSDGT